MLTKGLSFAPTHTLDLCGTLLDVNRLARKLTLNNHFLRDEDSSDTGGDLTSNQRDTIDHSGTSPNDREDGSCTITNKNITFAELCAVSNLRLLESEGEQHTIKVPPPIQG